MRTNKVKEKLHRGEPVLGLFCNFQSPGEIEVLGWLGYDFAIIDAEHSTVDYQTMENMVRAAEVSGTAPFARIGLGVQQNILRFLDAGVIGAQIPLVNTGEQARAVVEAVKYPPLGKRGLAGVRAGSFGILESMGDYVTSANRETLVTVQVETTEALDNLDDILAVDGVDVVFLGPSDLSSSMGYTGQPTHPDVITAIAGAGKRIAAAGKYAGTIARDPDAYAQWREAGFQYLCTGVSALLIQSARGYLEGCRKTDS